MRLCHDKEQLYVRLQKSSGAELLVDQRGEMRFWCEQPGCCPPENCHIVALRCMSHSCVSLALHITHHTDRLSLLPKEKQVVKGELCGLMLSQDWLNGSVKLTTLALWMESHGETASSMLIMSANSQVIKTISNVKVLPNLTVKPIKPQWVGLNIHRSPRPILQAGARWPGADSFFQPKIPEKEQNKCFEQGT